MQRTPTTSPTASSAARGHYQSAGWAVLGMGCVGIVGWAGAFILEVPAQVVDRPAMVATSAILMAIGLWMLRIANMPWVHQAR